MKTPTDKRIDEIEEKWENANGPWRHLSEEKGNFDDWRHRIVDADNYLVVGDWDYDENDPHGQAIADAPEDIAWLIDELRNARTKRYDDLKAAFEGGRASSIDFVASGNGQSFVRWFADYRQKQQGPS